MTRFGVTVTVASTLFFSAIATPGAFAGIFDFFHCGRDECECYPQCCSACEKEDNKHHCHCCFWPPAPPDGDLAYSLAVEFDRQRVVAGEERNESKEKNDKNEAAPAPAEKSGAVMLADLERQLQQLTKDVKALEAAVKKIDSAPARDLPRDRR